MLFRDLPYICPMQEPAFLIEPVLSALGQHKSILPLITNSEKYASIQQSYTANQLYAAIRTIGKILDVQEQAEQLVEPLEERTNIIEHKLKFIADEQKPAVLCLSDVSPPNIVQSEYLDALIRLAGGIPFSASQDDTFRPDVLIILSDEPAASLFNQLPVLLSSNTWATTPAVEKNNVFIIPEHDALRHPGLSVADDAEILAEIISSKYFVYGNEGTSWIRFELT